MILSLSNKNLIAIALSIFLLKHISTYADKGNLDNNANHGNALVVSDNSGSSKKVGMEVSLVSESKKSSGAEMVRVPIRAVDMRLIVSDLFGLNRGSKVQIKGLDEVNSENFGHNPFQTNDFTVENARDEDEWNSKFFIDPRFDEFEVYNADDGRWHKPESKKPSTAVAVYNQGNHKLKDDIQQFIKDNVDSKVQSSIEALFNEDVGPENSDDEGVEVVVKQVSKPKEFLKNLEFSKRNIYCTPPKEILAGFRLAEVKKDDGLETKVVMVALADFGDTPAEQICDRAYFRDENSPGQKFIVHIRDYYKFARKIEYATIIDQGESSSQDSEESGALVPQDKGKDEL